MDNYSQGYNNSGYNNAGYNVSQSGGKKGMSIASMVCGIVSLLCCCSSVIPILNYIAPFIQIIVAIAGLVLGIISKKNNYEGQGMALAGIITSALGLVGFVIVIILIIVGVGSLAALGGFSY